MTLMVAGFVTDCQIFQVTTAAFA